MSRQREDAGLLARLGAASSVATLVAARACAHPDRIAVEDDRQRLTYAEFDARVGGLARVLAAKGSRRGTRIALLSENRLEYLEVVLAAARIGAVVACQNARLTEPELAHCVTLVEPLCAIASPRHADRLAAVRGVHAPPVLVLDALYETRMAYAEPTPIGPEFEPEPEDPLLILYTSGSTGLPKGAVVSHRAEIARGLVLRAEYGLAAEDTFVAWPPLYHMGALEGALATLMSGGTVVVVDGYQRARLADLVATRRIGYLLLMPGMVGSFAAELRARRVRPQGIRVCGVMADLVPPEEIAEITKLLGAPYGNTFGSTETGWPPCSSDVIPVGVAPTRLNKTQSPFCEVRLVDEKDRDVEAGTQGELCMRGPTLFSGYFRDPQANRRDFRGGWFHMGDVFVREPDGTMRFVDRLKYLIKSGGESVYPAEIERVLKRDARVAEACVVRRADAHWGEVPVAFVARRDDTLGEADLRAAVRGELAGYKQPKQIVFLSLEEFPRNASGKVERAELERRLRSGG